MDLELTKRTAVKFMKQAMYMSTQFLIEVREKLRELLLSDRGSEINVPSRQAGECLRVARQQTMEESGAAA